VPLKRHKLDDLAFVAALATLGAASLGFVSARNGAALVMCAICIAGLIAGRLVGVSGRTMLPVALGIVFILYLVWIDPPGGPRRTSAFAHGAGGMLAGWALAVTLRGRLRWPAWGAAALVGAVALAVTWELGEWVGDRVLETALIPNKRDSALDIFFGSFGAVVGVAGVRLLDLRRRPPD
jgi:hypothetical protein